MATNFPSSLDNFTNPVSGNTLDSPSHSLQHSDANDAIEAIETKLGIGNSPAGSATSGYVLMAGSGGTTTWSALPDTGGLIPIVPPSVTVGSGSGSVGTSGLITFTSVSSISVNSFITSTYNKYKINLDLTNSTLAQCYFRFRTGSTDKAAEYYGAGFKSNYASATGSNQPKNNGTEAWVSQIATSNALSSFDLYKASATAAGIKGLASDQYDAQVIMFAYWNNNITSSGDGFTIYPSSGTMSGTIRIYGYKN